MAESNEKIKYSVEIDTESGKTQVKKAFSEGIDEAINESDLKTLQDALGSGGGGEVGDISQLVEDIAEEMRTVRDLIDDNLTYFAKENNTRLTEIYQALSRTGGGSGTGGNVPPGGTSGGGPPAGQGGSQPPGSDDSQPDRIKGEADRTQDILQELGSRARSASVAGISAASGDQGSMGAMIGMAGAAMGGPMGTVIAGFGALSEAVQSLAQDLEYYSSDIFSAMTEFEVTMMGLRFQLGRELGPVLSDLIKEIQELLVEVLPELVPAIQKIVELLEAGISSLQMFFHTMDAVVHGLKRMFRDAQGNAMNAEGEFAVMWTGINAMMGESNRFSFWEGLEMVGAGGLTGIGTSLGLMNPISQEQENEVTGRETHPAEKYRQLADYHLEQGVVALESVWNEATEFFGEIKEFFGYGKAKTEEMEDELRQGAEIALALFKHMEDWSQTMEGHGPQFDPGNQEMRHPGGRSRYWRDTAPSLGGETPVDTFTDPRTETQPNERQRGAPRPTPAGVTFRVTDDVQIHAQDETRLHDELLQFRQMVEDKMQSMKDQRWIQIAKARHGFSKGI